MGEGSTAILRRPPKGPAASAAAPLTPSRAMRLAFSRAADRAAGLAVAVLGVAEEVAPLDDLLSRLEPDLMLLSLERGGEAVGLLAFDAEARAAAVEAQTLGRPSAQPPEPREATAVDAALALPIARAFLDEAEAATVGTPLAGWIGPTRAVARLPSPREAGLLLADGSYRAVRLTLDLGAGGRQGLCLLLLPVVPSSAARDDTRAGWRDGLGEQVLSAPAEVTAVLHRLRVPLAEAEGLLVGQILQLDGVSVASVRLEGPGGADLGPARLGQVAGLRAVRIESPPRPRLDEVAPRALAPLGLPLST